jgi:menaquinone-dependent protoporphyrinogen oxidase
MTETTLVAYGTAKGSTRGVAERIAAKLESLDTVVEAIPLRELTSVGAYRKIVVGSAIHSGQWLDESAEAVTRLAPELRDRTVWAFSVCSIGETSSNLRPGVAKYLRSKLPEPDAVRELRAATDVVDHRFFAGAIAPGDWAGVGRIVFRCTGGRYGDARDWADIDRWAESMVEPARTDERPAPEEKR